MTDTKNPKPVDWTHPLVAVHPDGRRVDVRVIDGPDKEGEYQIAPTLDRRVSIFRKDGCHVFEGKWRIENRTPQSEYPANLTPELAERMVDHLRKSRCINAGDDLERQDLLAELEPDPIEVKARAIVKTHYPEATDSYNGRRMTIAREAIKAGMELAEAKP